MGEGGLRFAAVDLPIASGLAHCFRQREDALMRAGKQQPARKGDACSCLQGSFAESSPFYCWQPLPLSALQPPPTTPPAALAASARGGVDGRPGGLDVLGLHQCGRSKRRLYCRADAHRQLQNPRTGIPGLTDGFSGLAPFVRFAAVNDSPPSPATGGFAIVNPLVGATYGIPCPRACGPAPFSAPRFRSAWATATRPAPGSPTRAPPGRTRGRSWMTRSSRWTTSLCSPASTSRGSAAASRFK